MANRKKRLEKGIASLNAQIKIHEEKIARAIEEGNLDLEEYYQKEIKSLKKVIERKESQI